MKTNTLGRRALIVGVASSILSPGLALAQNGFAGFRNDLQSVRGDGFGPVVAPKPIVIETPASTAVRNGVLEPLRSPASQAGGAAYGDWRSGLLQGDRTLLVRRNGGPAERVTYINRDGSMNVDGYRRMCWLMRDVRADVFAQMDIDLMDMMCGLQRWAAHNGVHSVVTVTSGLRTDKTNSSTEGAAKNSLHKEGRAVDFIMDGIRSGQLGAMVSTYRSKGGTGIYLDKNFVHADTGRTRTWRG